MPYRPLWDIEAVPPHFVAPVRPAHGRLAGAATTSCPIGRIAGGCRIEQAGGSRVSADGLQPEVRPWVWLLWLQ